MAVLLYSASGIIAENQARLRLSYVICVPRRQAMSPKQDARIEQKRWAATAAQRQYTGYQLFQIRWKRNIVNDCDAVQK